MHSAGQRLCSIHIIALMTVLAGGCSVSDSFSVKESGAIVVPGNLEIRRVWSGLAPDLYVSSPSPDGRQVTEVDWNTGDLSVIDLESGKERRITNKGTWEELDAFAEYSVFSPDGKRLAYSWGTSAIGDSGQSLYLADVRTIGLDGSDTRVLFHRNPDKSDVSYVRVEDWSADGKSVLVTLFRTDRTSQIGVISTHDEAYRAVKTNGWRAGTTAAFSSDSRYIAYDLPARPDAVQRDIFALAADGSSETPLVTEPSDDQLLGWLPDGSGILYHSETEQAANIWALRVVQGHPAGSPQLVRSDVWGVTPFGFSRDALFYGLLVEQPQVYAVSVDLDGGRVLDTPQPLGVRAGYESHDAAWAPDGQSIAYIEGRNLFQGVTLVIREATGELRRIPLRLGRAGNLQWTPDGTSILMRGIDDQGHRGIHRVNLSTGESELLVALDPNLPVLGVYGLSPDGRTLYHLSPAADTRPNTTHVIAYDMQTGKTRTVGTVSPSTPVDYLGVTEISVSPDGLKLAVTTRADATSALLLMPVQGGEPRELRSSEGLSNDILPTPWTPDGKAILWYKQGRDKDAGVWRVPVDGSQPRLLFRWDQLISPNTHDNQTSPSALPFVPVGQLRLSPDGRRILYTTGEYWGEHWRISGFAPADDERDLARD